jgi:hypothetical protein
MSHLARRSPMVLALLFGLVFAVGIGLMRYADVPIAFAIFFAVFIVGLQYLLGPVIIDNIFTIRWMAPDDCRAQGRDWLYSYDCGWVGDSVRPLSRVFATSIRINSPSDPIEPVPARSPPKSRKQPCCNVRRRRK